MNDDTPRIHLGSLLRGSGDASVSGEVQELHYEQAGRPQTLRLAAPAPYGIDVSPLEGNELWLQGYFEPVLDQECSRCLKPVTVPLDLKLGTLMQYRPAVQEPFLEEADSGEELLIFGNPDLDLSSYLAEMTLLSSPLSVLHDPDCKGLCQGLRPRSERGAVRAQRRRAHRAGTRHRTRGAGRQPARPPEPLRGAARAEPAR